MLGKFTWILLGAMVALATHISYVLFQPSRAFDQQLSKQVTDIAPNRFRILTPEAQRALLPSYRGDSVVAVCALDLRNGSVKLAAQLPQSYWTAAIHTYSGLQVYSINDAEAESESIEIRINLARGMISQVLEGVEGEGATSVANAGWTVEMPEARGLAVIWVPLADPLIRPDVEATLGKSTCSVTT